MMVGEIPWFKERIVIREPRAPGNPAGEIRITQFANSLEGVQTRYKESANIENTLDSPSYSGPDSRGRWTVTWKEIAKAGFKNTSRFGWYSKRKK